MQLVHRLSQTWNGGGRGEGGGGEGEGGTMIGQNVLPYVLYDAELQMYSINWSQFSRFVIHNQRGRDRD